MQNSKVTGTPCWKLAAAAVFVTALPLHSADLSYFVGIDGLPTISGGTYDGLPNPNYQRLTFLWGHPSEEAPSSSHYHSKAIYRYSGENLGLATAVTFAVSDYVPEGSIPPLRLELGTGLYAGKLITSPYANPADPAYHFSNLEIGSVQSLGDEPAGSPELFLFNSSGGRWNSPFESADLHLELVSLTPGLHVGGLAALSVGLNLPGDDLHLGEGSEMFSFTPVLWVDETAGAGVYEATFKLTDESGAFGDSGEFRIRAEVVPEPSAVAVMLSGLGCLLGFRRRQRRFAGSVPRAATAGQSTEQMQFTCKLEAASIKRVRMRFRASSLRFVVAAMSVGCASGHDAFLPLHEHRPAGHSHGSHAGHAHAHVEMSDGKHTHVHEDHATSRWVIATGGQYTRYSVEGTRAELWETGLGFEFAVLPWLHVGGDVSYGWFDSALGNTSGLMMPHAHVDAHIPLSENLEFLIGGTIGFPGGDEGLVGDHWEFEPHVELFYDRSKWFVRAGAGFIFTTGGSSHEHEEEHETEGEEHHDGEEHDHEEDPHDHGDELHAGDFHEITHPHADVEFNYYGAAGVRLLKERLSLEARLSGIHVLRGETEHRNFLRAGLLASFQLSEATSLTAKVSVPITDAERNQVQASIGFRLEF